MVPVYDDFMEYFDYSSSMVDNIKLEDFDLSGKNIENVESKDTVLKSDMYTNGFDDNATYVEGETCYIIIKIN